MPLTRMTELEHTRWVISLIDFTASKLKEKLTVDPRYHEAHDHLFEARRLLMLSGQDIAASIAFYNGNPTGDDDGAAEPTRQAGTPEA
jgi:hypothetical protein